MSLKKMYGQAKFGTITISCPTCKSKYSIEDVNKNWKFNCQYCKTWADQYSLNERATRLRKRR